MKITGKVVALSLFASIFFLMLGTGIFFYFSWDQARKGNDQNRLILEHTTAEQTRIGIQCLQLKVELGVFLRAKVGPIISARKKGEAWGGLVSNELRIELDRHENYLFTCERLFNIGKEGKLNNLQQLVFVNDAAKEFSTLSTLLKYAGQSEVACNKQCLDSKFSILEESYKKLILQ